MELASGLDEPMQMAILENYDLVIVERKGAVRYFDNQTKALETIAQINVFSGIEDGLLGVAIDPDFRENHWIYFYFGVGGDRNVSHLARFELKGKQLDMSSKKVLLEVPTQRTYCCHSAGYLTFDTQGLLYLSIGDNTNAEEIEGHNPTDERPGRHLSDGQATSANSNDFRGKILRIRPEPDGTYTIPDGNLFPKDGSLGKPEIFVMGCRNPFRVSVDPKHGFVYWGDIGPDSQVPAEEANLSYDEINQARTAGFYGYPYFLGANEAFPKYDFQTKKEGPSQDPMHPVNNSPNNTGIRELPPAQPAFIWYGKAPSRRWPLVGKGGASAMAGPVYYSDLYPDAPYKLPEYYHGKLFIYDFMRKWIMAVTLDEHGNYMRMEPFLPHLKLVAPIDMQIARDGAIYLLAYGTNWFARSADSGIIRVEYSKGNRRPIASARVSHTAGAVPLRVTLSASGSSDFDKGDQLSYVWNIGKEQLVGEEVNYTFTHPGVYNVVLTVADDHGAQSTATVQVIAGNTPPDVTIQTQSNRSFYWTDNTFDYRIVITDPEDKQIAMERTRTYFSYLPYGKDLASILSDGNRNPGDLVTEKLYSSLDCSSCHTPDTKSIGPSLKEIARHYTGKKGIETTLAQKIIQGGSGNWGSYPMPPHPDLSEKDALQIAAYILSLNEQRGDLPLEGKIKLSSHAGHGTEGVYVLQASYSDNGANGVGPLKSTNHIVLRNPLVQVEDYDEGNVQVVIATLNTDYVSYLADITHDKYVVLKGIDLSHIRRVRFRVREQGAGGTIEIRLGSRDGRLAGSAHIPEGASALKKDWTETAAELITVDGTHDIFFLFKNPETKKELFNVDWVYFEK